MSDTVLPPQVPYPQPTVTIVQPNIVSPLIVTSADAQLVGAKQFLGEVINVEGNKVTLKTDQGQITFESDVTLQLNEKILIKLQNSLTVDKNILNLAQFLIQNDKKIPIVQTNQAILPNSLPPQIQSNLIDDILNIKTPILQVSVLPQKVDLQTQEFILRSLLQINQQTPLPPPIQEALLKANDLSSLLKSLSTIQINSANELKPLPISELIRQIMTVLKELPQAQNALRNNSVLTPQMISTLPPGSPLTEEIAIQINTAFIQNNTSAQKSTGTSTPLIAISLPHLSLPLAVVPAISGAVVPTQQAVVLTTPVLVMIPQQEGQPQIGIGYMNPTLPTNANNTDTTIKPLLPGTVFVLDVAKSQATQITQISTLTIENTVRAPISQLLTPLNPALGETWPSVQNLWIETIEDPEHAAQIAALLKQFVPMIGTSLNQTNQMMPNQMMTAQQLTPAILLFMALMKNSTSWSITEDGDLQHALSPKRLALLTQLGQDIATIRDALSDQTASEVWRPLPMPLQMGDQILRLQWFYRVHEQAENNKDDSQAQDQSKKKMTRFLLDVPETKLGDIQIDGLVKPQQLDVILRTTNELDFLQRTAIGERFQKALDISGFQGGLSFQSGAAHYVRV